MKEQKLNIPDMVLRALKSILFFCFSYVTMQAQQAGDLDSTFGINGKIMTSINGVDDRVFAIDVQPDGKIIVGGSTKVGTEYDFVLARYLIEGILDTTFGMGGVSITSVGDSNAVIKDIKILDDGKILATGDCFNGINREAAIVRFDSLGVIDSTFGINGVKTIAISIYDNLSYSLAAFNSEKYYISINGSFTDAIVKLNENGDYDSSFAINGVFVLPPVMSFIRPLLIKGADKLIAGGYTNLSNTDFAVICIDTLGALDSTFGNNGVATTDFASPFGEQINSIGLLSDSSIIAGGGLDFSATGSNWDFALSKYFSNGIIDSTFGINGKVVTSLSNGRDILMKILIQPDDKIIAVGYSSGNTDFALVRYNSNGTLDNTFGNNGVVITDFLFNSDLAYTAILQSDLKILAAGTPRSGNTWNFGLARYLSGLNVGLLEFKNEPSPLLIYPNPVLESATISYTLNQNQKITMSLHDLTGRTIKTFLQSENKSEGEHTEYLYFDKGLKAGVYILKIDDGNASRSIKIIKN